MEQPKIVMQDNDVLCPCCKHKTIVNLGDYEVCSICGWEDDPYQFEHPDYTGGANKMSLNQAREAYKDNIKVH